MLPGRTLAKRGAEWGVRVFPPQAELLDLVAKEKEKSQPSGKKKKGKKGGKAAEKEEAENEGGKPPAAQQCRQCAALQQSCRCAMMPPAGQKGRGQKSACFHCSTRDSACL